MAGLDPLSPGRRFLVFSVAATVLAAPWVAVLAPTPSAKSILSHGEMKIADIRTKAGTDIELHVMIGDVLRPIETRNDLGFDLVAISLYFDPLHTPTHDVIVANPLLASALLHAARDSGQYQDFVRHLLVTLYQSQEALSCYLRGESRLECRGDKIVPYIWGTFQSSSLGTIQGVKYIGALPLFDPLVVSTAYSDAEFRRRLEANLDASVRRLIDLASDSLGRSLRSIGFAALGSTSHRGGDSPAFLQFAQGFSTIVRAVEASRPSVSLDRVYLVAFNRHQGAFLTDAVAGLRAVALTFWLRRVTSGPGAIILGFVVAALFVIAGVLLYQGSPRIAATGNRWAFVGTVSAVAAGLGGGIWTFITALAEVLPPYHPLWVLLIYSALSTAGLVAMAWLSKRKLATKEPAWRSALRR